MTAVERLSCGCPTGSNPNTHPCAMTCGCPVTEDGHQPGCWMAEAEAIAREVDAEADEHPTRHRLIATLEALAAAGHLREPTCDAQLLGLLDELTEAGLLGPAGGGTDG